MNGGDDVALAEITRSIRSARPKLHDFIMDRFSPRPDDRAKALCSIANAMIEAGHQERANALLNQVASGEHGPALPETLLSVSTALFAAGDRDRALAVAEGIKRDEVRTEALVSYCLAVREFRQAETLARSIESERLLSARR